MQFAIPLLAALGFTLLPTVARAEPSSKTKILSDIGIDYKPGAAVPRDLAFRDQAGRSVTLGEYFDGKPVILNLVYFECPMLCNMVMDGLIRSLRTLSFSAGEKFTIVTVSFDPREGPRLAAAARRTALSRYNRDGAAAGWHFLTGEEPQIRELTRAVGFRYAWNPNTGNYAHAAGLIFLTPEGKVSRYLNGVEFPARDLRMALDEASNHEIGTITDQVLLFCYQYDPTTGRYGLAIHRILQVFGLLTLFGLLGGVALMLRRERRARIRAGYAVGGRQQPESEPTIETGREVQE